MKTHVTSPGFCVRIQYSLRPTNLYARRHLFQLVDLKGPPGDLERPFVLLRYSLENYQRIHQRLRLHLLSHSQKLSYLVK
jgi:hypothetical protein